MSGHFIGGESVVWAALTDAARASRRAHVAVAYLGKGGAKRLPLPAGSRLVVDASEATVKTGATNPEELLKFVERGVDVYSRPCLHAKVFVFARAAFVGSANVSDASACDLAEAVIRTTDAEEVRKAREFVLRMCEGPPLGPETLRNLMKVYRPPRRSSTTFSREPSNRPRFWFEEYETDDYPAGSEVFVKQLLREARDKRRHGKRYQLTETWLPGSPRYRKDDILMTVNDAGMVDAPGRVVAVREWSNGARRHTFSILEAPSTRRVALHRLAESLGYGWKKRLSKRGRLSRPTAAPVLAWWAERT